MKGIITGESIQSNKNSGTFTMSVCRNLNPFSSSGSHCSSPAGICFHSPDSRHVVSAHSRIILGTVIRPDIQVYTWVIVYFLFRILVT